MNDHTRDQNQPLFYKNKKIKMCDKQPTNVMDCLASQSKEKKTKFIQFRLKFSELRH